MAHAKEDRAIARDLAPRLRGEVFDDEAHRAIYSTAACIFEKRPLAIVAPADEADVRTVLDYAVQQKVPITARGAGTGVAGQSVGAGIVLDFARRMNRILAIDPAARRARVEPGVTLHRLNEELARHGLTFAPNPASGAVCTVGGMVANNAAGTRTIKYGVTRDHVVSLRWIAPNPDAPFGVARSWEEMRPLAERHCPRALKNSSGYHVYDRELDVTRLLVGSEGTLALVTEIELDLTPLPAQRVVARLGFPDLDAACAAIPAIRDAGVSACEILDETVVELFEKHRPEAAALLPRGARYVLLVEIDENHERAVDRVRRAGAATFEVAGAAEVAKLWKARKLISPILERIEGPRRSCRLIEDIAVMPDRMGDLARGLRELFEHCDAPGVIFGHAGDGHLHVNVLLDPADPETPRRMEHLAGDAADLAHRLQGTLSGEHGDGILRAPRLPMMFGELYPFFQVIKGHFDPRGLLNPGVKVSARRAEFTRSLRAAWHPRGETSIADRCNGCGHCMAYCPVYLEEPREEHLPRALARAVASGLEEARGLVRPVAGRCASCGKCADECPAGFDAVRAAAVTR